jgi:hypothetical protein
MPGSSGERRRGLPSGKVLPATGRHEKESMSSAMPRRRQCARENGEEGGGTVLATVDRHGGHAGDGGECPKGLYLGVSDGERGRNSSSKGSRSGGQDELGAGGTAAAIGGGGARIAGNGAVAARLALQRCWREARRKGKE